LRESLSRPRAGPSRGGDCSSNSPEAELTTGRGNNPRPNDMSWRPDLLHPEPSGRRLPAPLPGARTILGPWEAGGIRPEGRRLVQVSVYARGATGLSRVGSAAFLPALGLLGQRIVLDPPGCVPDSIARLIQKQFLAGADSGDVDRWHWRKEK
jgi:hypothetical protein